MWLSLPMLCPIIRPFIFRVLGFPYHAMAPGLVLYTRCILSCKNSRLLHLCCINGFWLSGKVFTSYLDNNTAKAYLCYQASTTSLCLSRVACYILTGQIACYYSYSSIHKYQSQCGSLISLLEKFGSRVAPASSYSWGCISPLGQLEVDLLVFHA